jgi:hypothetical protein
MPARRLLQQRDGELRVSAASSVSGSQ